MKKGLYKLVTRLGLVALAILVAGGACLFFSPDIDDEGFEEVERTEAVVLVHGMGRTELSMVSMKRTLEEQGYRVINWGYSSYCCSVDEIGQRLADDLDDLEEPRPDRLHFVGHSLGGIIIRWLLHHDPPPEKGRVVTLATPHRGAEVADRYVDYGEWLYDPLDDLTTDEESTARSLPPIEDRQVGTIAGEYDGKVAPEEARVPRETDHAEVPAHHSFLMGRADVQELVVRFLQNGRFD
ncbi:MAG: esterase/lipase family protein [Persicimonas sp.]